MSWKNIKTFLIILFLIINAYLIFSQYGFDFKSSGKTYVDEKSLSDTISIIQKNYNIEIENKTVPYEINNLGIIDVTNIIYTDKFKNSDYAFKTNGSFFEAEIETNTYSYNEINAGEQIIKVLNTLGIEKDFYNLDIKKSDEGLVCTVYEKLSPYPIFNGKIKAVFAPKKISLKGSWHIAEKDALKKTESPAEMAKITGVIIDMASKAGKDNTDGLKITNIEYGYFVSSYDENTASKTSSAIPCYMLKTSDNIKYYYDALNGKQLKQEE